MDMSVDEHLTDANFELYLSNLQNFIHDDEKIVTYKWLSNELSIHKNLSKELLIQFVTDQKSKKSDPISVTYLIYGSTEDGFKFQLIRDTDLSEARKQFKNVINEQIYSVQRKTNLTDLHVLYTVDKGLGKDCIGKIGFNHDIVRKEIKKIPVTIKNELPVCDSKSKSTEKKSGISNMFQNQTKKNVPKESGEIEIKSSKKTSPKKSSPETKSKQIKQPISKGGIANFFNKQFKTSEKSSVQSIKEKVPQKDNKSTVKISPPKQVTKSIEIKKEATPPKHNYRDILDSESDDDDLGLGTKMESIVKEKTETNVNDKKKQIEKPQTKRRRNVKDKDGNKSKRRKRIVQHGADSESSEDDIFAKDRSESPVATNKKSQISDDEDVDEVPSTPVSQHNSENSKKKRIGRQVDKTYLDDEGFFVTKKEFVVETESDTDNENVENNKNDNIKECVTNNKNITEEKKVNTNKSETKTKNDPKKKSPKKQVTLMNFFKKA